MPKIESIPSPARATALAAGLACLLVMVAPGAAARTRATFGRCGSDAAALDFNIEGYGLSCARVDALLPHLRPGARVTTVVAGREWRYSIGGAGNPAAGWRCLYTTSPSSQAQDGELESFDCSLGAREVRWTDAPGVLPSAIGHGG